MRYKVVIQVVSSPSPPTSRVEYLVRGLKNYVGLRRNGGNGVDGIGFTPRLFFSMEWGFGVVEVGGV